MTLANFAVVAIGRNEGIRLKKCLESVLASTGVVLVVYVDSGSTDGSVAVAQSLGCEVVELDLNIPFTAARARNEGFDRVMQLAPTSKYVQFVDGDCEIVSGWHEAAVDYLEGHPKFAAVCGRRRERHPERSIYNQLCDIEWNTPVGITSSCGGDVMMRVDALLSVGVYCASLIAGEEPELCIRLRAAGWLIWRLDHEMTLHDANMLYIRQWWSRCKRSGYAFAEGSAMNGKPPERHWVRQSRSAWLWGLIVPVSTIVLTVLVDLSYLWLLVVYPLNTARIVFLQKPNVPKPVWYATYLMMGKFPEMFGQIKFVADLVSGKRSKLIEYR